MHLLIIIVSSLLSIPLIGEVAGAADARAAGEDAPTGRVIVAGAAIAMLYPVGGVAVLVRRAVAVVLFLIATVFGLVVGRDNGWNGLALYGLISLALAGASWVCGPYKNPQP